MHIQLNTDTIDIDLLYLEAGSAHENDVASTLALISAPTKCIQDPWNHHHTTYLFPPFFLAYHPIRACWPAAPHISGGFDGTFVH